MWITKLLNNVEEYDREHIGNIKHKFFIGNTSRATKY